LGNVNVLTNCGNEKRYLQVNVQATGNYVVAAQAITRGSVLTPESVKLKRGRLDQLPPKTMLDISQAQDAVSLRDLSPDQPVQLDAAPGLASKSRPASDGCSQWRRL
jgi:flagella basal body P-ring formation protein FlgA